MVVSRFSLYFLISRALPTLKPVWNWFYRDAKRLRAYGADTKKLLQVVEFWTDSKCEEEPAVTRRKNMTCRFKCSCYFFNLFDQYEQMTNKSNELKRHAKEFNAFFPAIVVKWRRKNVKSHHRIRFGIGVSHKTVTWNWNHYSFHVLSHFFFCWKFHAR